MGSRRVARRGIGVLAPLLALVCLPVFAEADDENGAAAAGEAVAPPNLHRALAHFQIDLEMLRWVAGEPELTISPWAVSQVEPRHLLWQTRVMFRKASQLAEEVAGPRTLPLPPGSWRRSQPRPLPNRAVELADVLQVVVDAHDRVRAAVQLLNIRMVERRQLPRDATKTAGDVLGQIVQGNRQLNLMLHREVTARDAYNRVMEAVERAGDLLRRLPAGDGGSGGYPPAPPLDTGSTPGDVYRRLVNCLGLLQPVASAQQVRSLGLDLDRELAREDVSNADVYHLAITLLSDLEHMTSALNAAATKPPRGAYPAPRFVFPAHVHQIAGVLETQLRELATGPAEAPDATPSGATDGPG